MESSFAAAPRLRTILTTVLVAMLGVACLIIGLTSFLTLQSSLQSQVSERLEQTSHRALMFKPEDAPAKRNNQNGTDTAPVQPQSICDTSSGTSPLNAPGQSAGTLTLCVEDGTVGFSGVLDSSGDLQELSAADIETLKNISVDSSAEEVHLDSGDYLVEAHSEPSQSRIVVVTGSSRHEEYFNHFRRGNRGWFDSGYGDCWAVGFVDSSTDATPARARFCCAQPRLRTLIFNPVL